MCWIACRLHEAYRRSATAKNDGMRQKNAEQAAEEAPQEAPAGGQRALAASFKDNCNESDSGIDD